jgi:hypothetical protein
MADPLELRELAALAAEPLEEGALAALCALLELDPDDLSEAWARGFIYGAMIVYRELAA